MMKTFYSVFLPGLENLNNVMYVYFIALNPPTLRIKQIVLTHEYTIHHFYYIMQYVTLHFLGQENPTQCAIQPGRCGRLGTRLCCICNGIDL